MKNNRKKMILLLTMAALILVSGVGGTVAYLIDQAGEVENTFTPAYVSSAVIEPEETTDAKEKDVVISDNNKSGVQIKNTGNIKAYIRAAIVITWQDAQGNTLAVKPGANDYTLTIGADWTKAGDYYYYNSDVAPGQLTTKLIDSCTQVTNIGKYNLCVEVLGSAIQAEGMDATSAQAAFTKAAQ